jgi:RNA polymerase sigma-70 factor (ECF subfamily)
MVKLPPLFEQARARWPALALEAETFDRHVQEVTRADEGAPEHLADLFLACACAHGVPGAVEELERAYGTTLARAAAKVHRDPEFVADLLQAVRVHLLIPHGDGRPRIAEYAGRAPLARWLHVATTRLALTARRKKSEHPHEELTSGLEAVTYAAAPEIASVRARYADALGDSIRRSIARLSTRDRTLLRLHLADGMSIDRLATVYGVGRSTAARWLAAARIKLGEETRQDFCGRLHVTPSEFDSIAEALKSELDVSLIAHLGA